MSRECNFVSVTANHVGPIILYAFIVICEVATMRVLRRHFKLNRDEHVHIDLIWSSTNSHRCNDVKPSLAEQGKKHESVVQTLQARFPSVGLDQVKHAVESSGGHGGRAASMLEAENSLTEAALIEVNPVAVDNPASSEDICVLWAREGGVDIALATKSDCGVITH